MRCIFPIVAIMLCVKTVYAESPVCVIWIKKSAIASGTLNALVNYGDKENRQPIMRGDLGYAVNTDYHVLYVSTKNAGQNTVLKNAISAGRAGIIEKVWGANGKFNQNIGGTVFDIRVEKASEPPADFYKNLAQIDLSTPSARGK